MKGFAKLTKVTWQFYLVALIIMLLFTAADSLYVCIEDNSAYGGKLFHYSMEEDSAEQFLEKNGGILYSGKDISVVYCDKARDYEVFGYHLMLLLLIVIILLKQCVFMDVRTAEFQRTFPVKQWVQVLHDYLAVLGIIVLPALLQLGIFVAYQTTYNTETLKTAELFSITGGSEAIIAQSNEHLLLFWGIYFLYVAVAYTWIYVGMLLAKNPIVGVVLSIIAKVGVYNLIEIWQFYYREPDANFLYALEYIVEYISSPQEAFGLNTDTLMEGDSQMILATVCGLLGMIVLSLFLMHFVSERRELSKGKVLYFPILDYPLCLLVGLLIFSWFGYMPIHLIMGMIAVVIIFVLIHPWSSGKRTVLEVK